MNVLQNHIQAQINQAIETLQNNGYSVQKLQFKPNKYSLSYSEREQTIKLTQQDKILWLCKTRGYVTQDMAHDCFKISQFHTRLKELKNKGYKFNQKYNDKIKMNEYRLKDND